MTTKIRNHGKPAARTPKRVRISRLVFNERQQLDKVVLSTGDVLDVVLNLDDLREDAVMNKQTGETLDVVKLTIAGHFAVEVPKPADRVPMILDAHGRPAR